MTKDIVSKLVVTDVVSANTLFNSENSKDIVINRVRWGIAIYYDGETIYKTKEKTTVLGENNVVFLPKNSNYQWICTKSGHITIINFESDISYNELISISVENRNEILKKFKEAEIFGLEKLPNYKMKQIKTVYDILLLLLQEKKYIPSTKQEKLLTSFKYMCENYYKDISNEFLAKLSGMSTVYFRKLFTETYNASPIRYINSLRMEKAKEMLSSDFSRIVDVATSVGFSDIYHFSKAFKKYTGQSPFQYSKTHAKL